MRDREDGAERAGPDAARAIDPRLFSPGACMAFPPTGSDRHVTDPFEASIAASAHSQEVIAGALAKAIEQYFTGS